MYNEDMLAETDLQNECDDCSRPAKHYCCEARDPSYWGPSMIGKQFWVTKPASKPPSKDIFIQVCGMHKRRYAK